MQIRKPVVIYTELSDPPLSESILKLSVLIRGKTRLLTSEENINLFHQEKGNCVLNQLILADLKVHLFILNTWFKLLHDASQKGLCIQPAFETHFLMYYKMKT